MATSLATAPALARPAAGHVQRSRLTLADGAATTVHVARYPARRVSVRLAVMRRPQPLSAWCAATGVEDAVVGGFFTRPGGIPLGDLRMSGIPRFSQPFHAPWDRVRACVRLVDGWPTVVRRDELAPKPCGDLLQAGPLLVRNGCSVACAGEDPEGFSAGADQFDSDITAGRYPRAALALAPGWVMALACDGRSHDDAGLTLPELAEALVALGADSAINLDGGGSTSLVAGGDLRNHPRADFGVPIPGGRAVATALVFEPRR